MLCLVLLVTKHKIVNWLSQFKSIDLKIINYINAILLNEKKNNLGHF